MVLTIGYGSTKGVQPFQTITHEEALKRLKRDVADFSIGVETHVAVPLTQNQFDALVSFAFNIGIGAFRKSTLLKKLNAKQYSEVPKEMQRWIYAKGHILGGLRERRKAEAALFSKPERFNCSDYLKSVQ